MKLKATNLLKKKKMYENQILNMENTQNSVESAYIQTQMIRDTNDMVFIISLISTIGQSFEGYCRYTKSNDE